MKINILSLSIRIDKDHGLVCNGECLACRLFFVRAEQNDRLNLLTYLDTNVLHLYIIIPVKAKKTHAKILILWYNVSRQNVNVLRTHRLLYRKYNMMVRSRCFIKNRRVNFLYKVGQLVVYGNKGVYKIEDIGYPEIEWLKSEREYYTLEPIFKGEKIFIPVDTDIFMRPVMSRDDALNFIRKIPQIDSMDNENFKNPRSTESYYQTSLESHDLTKVVSVIKHIHSKRVSARSKGRRIAQIDEKYMKRAENILNEEIAVIFEVQPDNVPELIGEILNEA